MSDKQVRIFYFAMIAIMILLFLFWSYFLKDKWQQKEVAIIDLEPYRVAQNVKPQEDLTKAVVSQVAIELPPGDVQKKVKITLPAEDVFWGNRGYTTKDGKTTYRPGLEGAGAEEGVDDL